MNCNSVQIFEIVARCVYIYVFIVIAQDHVLTQTNHGPAGDEEASTIMPLTLKRTIHPKPLIPLI
jgi:hypothetical protein